MRKSRHSKYKEPPELDITAFLNLMVVLVPFLLITAVFSRITILQLDLPASVGNADPKDEKKIEIEVMVRKDSIDLGDGRQIIMRIPKLAGVEVPGEQVYDIKMLSKVLLEIKGNYPLKKNASVLMESDVEYEYLVKIMDAVSGAEQIQEDGTIKKIELFPEISVGDAPKLLSAG